MPSSRFYNYCYTLNNYTEDDLARIESASKCTWFRYTIFGKEVGEQGTPHLQGYLQLSKQVTMKWLKKNFSAKAHWEVARGSLADNTHYTSKDANVTEYGTPKEESASKRGQAAWHDINATIKQLVDQGEDYDIIYLALRDKYPGMTAAFDKAISKWINNDIDKRKEKDIVSGLQNAVLREWQQVCLDQLEHQSNRHVLWVYDKDGNTGKTFLAKYIRFVKKGFYMENAKKCDIALAWAGQELVVANLTRDKEDITNYSVFESLKDGLIFSGKYQSALKFTEKNVKIAVMANWLPVISKLSLDRWQIMVLQNDQFYFLNSSDVANIQHAQETAENHNDLDRMLNASIKSAYERFKLSQRLALVTRKRNIIICHNEISEGPPRKKRRIARCCDKCGRCNCQPMGNCH